MLYALGLSTKEMASSEESPLRVEDSAENWCHTVVVNDNGSLLWTIENFTQCPHKNTEYLQSSNFQTSEFKLNWYLRIFPRGDKESAKEFVSVYLVWDKKEYENELSVKFTFSIINKKGEKAKKYEGTFKFDENHKTKINGKFIERGDLCNQSTDLLPNGNLKLYCELTVTHHALNISGTKSHTSDKVPSYDLSERIGMLILNPIFSDVTLDINGRDVLAHKAILSAGSPVFAAMFTNDMKEKNENRVKITDIPYDIMKDVLNFIYTGRAPNLKSSAYILLSAADKYGLEDLKVKCEEEIFSTITVKNAADALLLADRHNCTALKSYALRFITDNCGPVKSTDGWKNLLCNAPHLIDEAYCSLSDRLNPIISLYTKENNSNSDG